MYLKHEYKPLFEMSIKDSSPPPPVKKINESDFLRILQ